MVPSDRHHLAPRSRQHVVWLEFGQIMMIAAMVTTAAIARAYGTEPLGTADETAHLDYAFQLWNGRLPVFEDGVSLDVPFGVVPPVQWVAQHPPLFYLMLAPIVGPIITSGDTLGAVMAGRIANGVLAGIVVIAAAWAVRQVAPETPRLRIVVPLVTGLTGMLVLVGSAIYNDLATVLFATLAIGLIARLTRRGLDTVTVLLVAVVSAAGMSTRASFGVFSCFLGLAVLIGPRRDGRWWNGFVGRSVAAVTAVVCTLAAIGWFFWRNVQITGRLDGGHPDWAFEHLYRTPRTFAEVILDPDSWAGLFNFYRFDAAEDDPAPWLLLVVPAALAIIVGAIILITKRRSICRDRLVVFMLTAALTAGIVMLQLNYATNAGAINSRYLLPVAVVFAIVLGYGLVRIPWSGVLLVPAWGAASWLVFASSLDPVRRISAETEPEFGQISAHLVMASGLLLVGTMLLYIVQNVSELVQQIRHHRDERPSALSVDAGAER